MPADDPADASADPKLALHLVALVNAVSLGLVGFLLQQHREVREASR